MHLVTLMAKMTLVLSDSTPQEFVKNQEALFREYRGTETLVRDEKGVQLFAHYDAAVSDFSFIETDNHLFAELGINYSQKKLKHRMESLASEDIEGIQECIDGEVCQILVDKADRRVIVATDAFGLNPLYMSNSETATVLSTDIKGVLSAMPGLRTDINSVSVAEFLSGHFIMENRTLFDGVRLLPEASIMEFAASTNIRPKTRTWFELPREPEERPIREWIELVARAFGRSISKRAREGLGTFLSGGMDSRVILASIPPQIRETMTALTFGIPGADDCRIARRVSAKYGVRLIHKTLTSSDFLENVLLHMWVSEGVSNHLVSPIIGAVASLGVDAIFDGFAGDTQFGGAFHDQSQELDDGLWPAKRGRFILQKMQQKGIMRNTADVNRILANTDLDGLDRSFAEAVENEAAALPSDMNPQLVYEQVLFRLRIKRHTLGGQLSVDYVCPSLKPYYDSSFVETILRIPPRMRRHHGFFNEFVRSVLPSTLKIETNREMPYLHIAKYKRLLRRYVAAIARRFGVFIPRSRPWAEPSRMLLTDPQYRKWLYDLLLGKRTEARCILEPEGIKDLFKEHLAKREDHSGLLMNAADLELTLRLFSDGDGFRLFAGER